MVVGSSFETAFLLRTGGPIRLHSPNGSFTQGDGGGWQGDGAPLHKMAEGEAKLQKTGGAKIAPPYLCLLPFFYILPTMTLFI